MAKLTLNPPPTWQKAVELPVPGGTASVTFTFRRMDLPQLKEFIAKLGEMTDVDAVAAVVTGWNLDDILDADAIATLCTTYPGSGFAILREYMRESMGRPFELKRIADLE
ncbi:phage tail assembly chaperone [Pseudoxanthomonas sp.]|uniref:phage tail assembly chaperone n=1 Tax=Pseudoxanthomonas sp. TaxID=1871049 RepID=UPI0025F63FA8|nr:phage tail assembly chaperone [Pseudoxanthomonas sp.]